MNNEKHRLYQSFGKRTEWRFVEPILAREPSGYFGNYYVHDFEPAHVYGLHLKQIRGSVKRFLAWHGLPIKLDRITNQIIAEFQKTERERVKTHEAARQSASIIRRVVNHWQPGRLPMAWQSPLPNTKDGTVQHFVTSTFLPGLQSRKVSGVYLRHTEAVLRRLHVFCGSKGLSFAKFTEDFAKDFLCDCLKQGGAHGKPLSVETVNIAYRFALGSISREAAKAGLMKRRLRLDPVAPLKRRPRPSTNGHAKPAARKRTTGRPGQKPGKRNRTAEWLLTFKAEHPDASLEQAARAYNASHAGEKRPLTRGAADQLLRRRNLPWAAPTNLLRN